MPERPSHTQYAPATDTGEGEDVNGASAPPGDTPQDPNDQDHKADKSARLAALRPHTLATMHGSVYAGDGAQALHDLAQVFREVLGGGATATKPAR